MKAFIVATVRRSGNVAGREMGHLVNPLTRRGALQAGALAAALRVPAMTDIAHRHTGQTVAVVTHSGMLMGFLERVLGMADGFGRRVRRENAAVNAFVYRREMDA